MWFLTALSWIRRNSTLASIVAAVILSLSAAWYLNGIFSERAELRQEVSELKAIAKANKEKHQQIVSGLTDKAETERKSYVAQTRIHEQIERDRREYDRPVSPVVRNALIGLHEYEAQRIQDSQ